MALGGLLFSEGKRRWSGSGRAERWTRGLGVEKAETVVRISCMRKEYVLKIMHLFTIVNVL